MENNAMCRDHPTMVSKPYYRVDLFNRQMTDVLLTSLLVTTIESKTVAHIGTSTGRLLQVRSIIWKNHPSQLTRCFTFDFSVIHLLLIIFLFELTACINKIQPCYLCQLLLGWKSEGVPHCRCVLFRVSPLCSWRQGTVEFPLQCI